MRWPQIARTLVLAAITGCASLQLDTSTPLSRVRDFPTRQQYEELNRRLISYLDKVDTSYAARSQDTHAQDTVRLLTYFNRIPLVYLDTFFDTYVSYVKAHGVASQLSFYVDYGLRLSCAGTPSASRRLRDLIALFNNSARGELELNRQAVFIRRQCSGAVDLQPLSDNVGWAVAAMLFSDFGRNLLIDSDSTNPLLETVQAASECSVCGEVGGGPSSGSIRGIAGAAPASSCQVINAGLAMGMLPATRNTFCRATSNVRGVGFAGASAACLQFGGQLSEAAGFSSAQKTFSMFQRFNEYIACKNGEFGNRRQSPFYNDLSQYFDGGSKGYGRKFADEPDGGTLWSRYFRNESATSFDHQMTKTDSSGNVVYRGTTHAEEGKEGATLHSYEENGVDGTKSASETMKTSDGEYKHTYEKDADKEKEESYTKDGTPIMKTEYDNARDKHFPGKPVADPSPDPDQPQSACDRILTDQRRPPIKLGDIRELIQPDPDDVMRQWIRPLSACTQTFEKTRRCHTILRCVDDGSTDTCSCRSFSPGVIGRTNQCSTIQCGPDETVVNCMCKRPNGGIVPGLGGPMITPPTPPIPFGSPR